MNSLTALGVAALAACIGFGGSGERGGDLTQSTQRSRDRRASFFSAISVAPRSLREISFARSAPSQQPDVSKPTVPLVSAVGCAQRTAEGTWMLTNATDGVESRVLFMSAKEIEAARKQALGKNSYRLLGTPEFLSKEELLKSGQRAEFTRPEVANATGQLQNGRKVFVKGLLIKAQNETRLNLVAVQQLAETCK